MAHKRGTGSVPTSDQNTLRPVNYINKDEP